MLQLIPQATTDQADVYMVRRDGEGTSLSLLIDYAGYSAP